MSIFVGNLPFRAEQEDVIELFAAFGEVTNCALPLERDSGRKRGFAFVEMADEAAEASAIDALQGAELMGRPLRINKAEPRGSAPRRGGGGGYGGGGGGYGGGGGGGGYRGAADAERGSGARGWEDRSYGGAAPESGGNDDGRTRRRRGGASPDAGGEQDGGYAGAEG
ncbi:MAG: RNA recognition motif domain-containing protein [Prochlorococcus sp.]